jgi:hypothetical protein
MISKEQGTQSTMANSSLSRFACHRLILNFPPEVAELSAHESFCHSAGVSAASSPHKRQMRSYASAGLRLVTRRCNGCGNVTASALSFFGGIQASEPCGNRQAAERHLETSRSLLFQQYQYLEARPYCRSSRSKGSHSAKRLGTPRGIHGVSCHQRRGDRTRIEWGRIFGYVTFFPAS